MAGSHAQRALGKLNHLLEAGAPAEDGRLLQRFVRDRDQEAFAQLVTRHGPLVLGVCRRVLHDLHEAEDVFQAAFLVLARKAASIRKPESLSCFLHGVAYRLALRARLESDRRRQRERHIPPPEPAEEPDLSWREVRALIDEELLRLPERLRLPLVLCYLEGETQDEAARRLGWPRGTLKRRLECGRDRLRVRLTRRGVTLGAGLFIGALTQSAIRGAVPAALRADTVRAALLFTGGEAGALTATPAELLAQAALQPASVLKLQWIGLLLLVLGGAVTAGLAVSQVPGDATAQPKANTPRPTQEKRVRTDRYGDALPDGATARLGTMRLRHTDMAADAVFTPDGKAVIVGDNAGNVIFWDVATAREVRRLPRAPGVIYALAITRDGKTLAAEVHGELILWDLATGKMQSQSQGTDYTIAQLLFTPDGKTLAVHNGTNTIILWDVAGNKKRHELKGHKGNLIHMALSPDGKTLASGSWQDGEIRLWDMATGKEKFHFPAYEKDVLNVAFSPDGKTLASTGTSDTSAVSTFFSPLLRTNDAGIRFWDAATGTKLREIPGRFPLALAYFPDGKTMVALEYERKVQVYDPQAGKPLREYDAPPHTMSGVTIAPDGKTVATFWGGSNTFDLWDATNGKLLHSFEGHRGAIAGLAFTADGQTLFSAAADRDSRLGVWDPFAGALRGWLGDNPNGCHALALSPDGKLLAAGGDGALILWDATTRKEVRRCRYSPWTRGLHTTSSVAWSADGKVLAASSPTEEAIRVWDPATGRTCQVIATPQVPISAIALSPDGTMVAAGNYRADGIIRLWSAVTGRPLPPIATPSGVVFAVAFSPDGSTLASGGSDGKISLWDPATGRLLSHWGTERTAPHPLTFSRDGRTLVSGHNDSTARLWEVATGKERACFKGHRGPVRALALSRDGRSLASGSEDTTILVWDATCEARPQAVLDNGQLQALWVDLKGEDARQAYRAMWQLALSPRQALPFLAERLPPVLALDARQQQQFNRLLADLDNEQFALRQRAETELEKMGMRIEPALHNALDRKPSLEVRRRIEKLLDKLAGARLRASRALEATEHMNTPEARQFVDMLAKGEPRAWLTQQARLVRERMNRQAP